MIGPYFKREKMQLSEILHGGKTDECTHTGGFYFLLMKSSLIPEGISGAGDDGS
jgi:hypothetical protein